MNNGGIDRSIEHELPVDWDVIVTRVGASECELEPVPSHWILKWQIEAKSKARHDGEMRKQRGAEGSN
ncbi:hypothetical protein MUK42_35151 [Musa troglodytarum]|uniref:Uncharacterized protein n=1 Tax=Musa troglodytarum TaxID=320322 RepID=A0A9E7EAQ1_9LILI|nr:hypothetical protein MUK42_35151 [Musa troglodytarum]